MQRHPLFTPRAPLRVLRAAAAAVVLCASTAAAGAEDEIRRILEREQAPTGVVFEIVSGEPGFLEQAIPAVRRYAERLRARFPGLSVAVVSHGREQFALTRSREGEHGRLHEAVRVMNLSEGIPVHVCGTFAAWNGVDESEFPPYVDVVSQGPSQVRDYLEFGYLRIVLEPSDLSG